MEVRWNLRMAAARREVWSGAELRRLLAERAGLELSAASVSALMSRQPKQLKLSTLAALCTALECGPEELIEVETSPVSKPTDMKNDEGEPRSAGGGSRVPPPF